MAVALVMLISVIDQVVPTGAEAGAAAGAEVEIGGRAGARVSRDGVVAAYVVGSRPRAVSVGDLDGDQASDLAIANSGDGTVSILLGSSAGAYRPSEPVRVGGEPSDIDLLDFDRDGDLDIVACIHETGEVALMLNDGRGAFAGAVGSPFDTGARPHVHGLATGDFDGDGWPDIAVDSADTDEVLVLRGRESGLPVLEAVPVGVMPYFRLGAADVDGDGDSDILVPGHRDRSVVAVTAGGVRRVAEELRGSPWMVAGGDLNGDGLPDLVVAERDGASVWLGDGSRFRQAPGSPIDLVGATEIAMGDLDGDGRSEAVVAPWDGDQVAVIRWDEASMAVVTSLLEVCERPIGLAIADLDGDGAGELLATCSTTSRVLILDTNGR